MYDITAIGEILVDFHCTTDNKISMVGYLGGATCNVVIQSTLLGNKSCVIGAVGNDVMGDFLYKRLSDMGVENYIQRYDAVTTMAIVTLDENNDRSFGFVRNPGADSLIQLDSNVSSIVSNSKVLMYGSLSFSKDPASSAIFDLLKNSDCIKAYDPNLRPAIWNDDNRMLNKAAEGLQYANILKIGDDELLQLANYLNVKFDNSKDAVDNAAEFMMKKFPIKYVFVTMGSKGCKYYSENGNGYEKAYNVVALDTTGAGDSFFGAILSQYIKNNLADISYSVKYACASGAVTASKKGTAEAMPNEADILKMMQKGNA